MCSNLAQEMQFVSTVLQKVDESYEDATAGGLEQRECDHGATASSRAGNLRADSCHARCPAEAGAGSGFQPLRADQWRKRNGKRYRRAAAASVFALVCGAVRKGQLPSHS